MIQIYHNNRCGKSREAVQKLEQSGKEFEVIKYLENTPTFEELNKLLNKLQYKPIDLIRQKESVWIENFKEKNLSEAEIVQAMVQFPILIERPIVVFGNKAIVARPVEKLNEYI